MSFRLGVLNVLSSPSSITASKRSLIGAEQNCILISEIFVILPQQGHVRFPRLFHPSSEQLPLFISKSIVFFSIIGER